MTPHRMKTLEMAKKAFESRRAADAWFKDAEPNFELFAEMVRKDERDAIIMTIIPGGYSCDPQTICDRIRERSNVQIEAPSRLLPEFIG